ncbi:hypothetical protein [Tabrizicola sp. BL-A-41-H6]|uniref:hypothetical protein n=1 Tax=Tabrizicola sp. BL-A-41-H6 TaxID=3421107 RepID=UPI003D66A0A4
MPGSESKTKSQSTREAVGEDILNEFQQLRADVTSLSASLQRFGTLQAEELATRAKGVTGEALDESLRSIREMRQKLDGLQQRLEGDVRAHPLASMAGVLCLGVIVGLLFARRN